MAVVARSPHRASSQVLSAFILTGLLFMLVPGTFLGVLNLIQVASRTSVSLVAPEWLQAHGHAQVFGWVGTFMLGIGLYSLPQLRAGTARSLVNAWACWGMWTSGVAMRWFANVYRVAWRPLLPISAVLELAAFLLFIRAVSRHPRRDASTTLEAWVKIVLIGAIGLTATLIGNLAACVWLALYGSTPALPHTVDQRFLALVTWGWLAPFVWGFSVKWLPVLLALRTPNIPRLGAGLGLNIVGVLLFLAGFVSLPTLALVGSTVLVSSALRIFEPAIGDAKTRGVHRTFPTFVRLAYAWLIVAAILGVAAARFDVSGGIWGASRHAFTVGFISVMVFAIGQRMLPAFAGQRPLWSPRLMLTGLALLNIGCALRVSAEIVAYQQSAPWAWKVLPVSAVIELLAVTIFAVNLGVTLLAVDERVVEGRPSSATIGTMALALAFIAAPSIARAQSVSAADSTTPPAPPRIDFTFQYRGRAEAQRGSALTNGRDDAYDLNRVRFGVSARMTSWLTGNAELQDARVFAYNTSAPPLTFADRVDLRQGYLEFRQPAGNGVGVRVGRQELGFGEQRLVGSLDWANTARSFDAVRFFVTQPGMRVDAFVSSVVVISPEAFDRPKTGETLSGVHVSLTRLVSKSVVEPYLFVRRQATAHGELSTLGDATTYTFGARAAGTLPKGFDYGAEMAAQRGHIAADSASAWAGHYLLGWTTPGSPLKPRVRSEFNLASGDHNPGDGRDETFDQLYPTGHNKFGLTDQVGWRNMREAMLGFDVSPTAKLKLNAGVHHLWLATVEDGLYGATGAEKVINRAATSRTLGNELDVQGSYAISRNVNVSAGLGTLFSGPYLVQSTRAGTLCAPYVMWSVKY